MDDLSVAGPSQIAQLDAGEITSLTIDSGTAEVSSGPLAALRAGPCQENATLLTGLISGEIDGAKHERMVLNAAAGFVVAGAAANLRKGVELAREQMESGRALAKLRTLQEFSAGRRNSV